jgi:hypothetical protein
MDKAVRKNMPALSVSGELDFINCKKRRIAIDRHTFDRTDKITRPWGDDLFFTRNQSNGPGALRRDSTVVVFTSQKA